MKSRFSLVRPDYLFGDHNLAARRLAKLHEVFAASSRQFLLQCGPRCGALGVDLGCGVGHTTELLRRTLQPAETLGLDTSAPFLERALSKYRRCQFALADAALPLPVVGADVLYARYLLAHLPGPAAVLGRWLRSLQPGGLLLLEENFAIHTQNPTFALYMNTIGQVMSRRGQSLYLGGFLEGLTPEGAAPPACRRTSVAVDAPVSAELFAMNFAAWKDSARDVATGETLARLEQELSDLSQSPDAPSLTFELSQVVFVRLGGA